mgnify:CR=1 FL=1
MFGEPKNVLYYVTVTSALDVLFQGTVRNGDPASALVDTLEAVRHLHKGSLGSFLVQPGSVVRINLELRQC